MLDSKYWDLGPITLPPYQARRKYMHTFDIADPVMAAGFEDYQDSVRELCSRARVFQGTAHMTVDEKLLLPLMSHRRPGPHVDGCFMPSLGKWGGSPHPGWNHHCNNVAGEAVGRMPVIIASNVIGCKAWQGEFEGEPTDDGDLSHLTLGNGEYLTANRGFLLSPDCIHESIQHYKTVCRTFLRIALPVNSLA